VLRLPIAHAEGNYYADDALCAALAADRQIAFRYCDRSGTVLPGANPNGATDAIAGVATRSGAVVGLMPHPERAIERLLGSEDGRLIFESLARWVGDARHRTAAAPIATGAEAR